MATQVEAARLLVYHAARLREDGATPFERFRAPAMAKYFASQAAEEVASQALDIFGGNGYIKDFPIEKLFRDAKVGKIYEGTSNMQLRTIATTLLQQP
jgi:alkylation response protein AidB-like acyl-CoA dehydrogenase